MLVSMTADLHRQGRERYGLRMLWGVLRWKVAMGTITVEEDFKLNDNYISRYVRLIVEKNPQYADMFELRALRAD